MTVATLDPEESRTRHARARSSSRTTRPSTASKQAGPVRDLRLRDDGLALDTLEGVGDKANDKEAVVKAALRDTKGRDSVLGTYDIDENGDTTLTDYGLYNIDGRRS